MTDTNPAAGGLSDPRTLEGALRYARTYWRHGSEPETQAALHVLAARTEAAERELARVTAAVEDHEPRWWGTGYGGGRMVCRCGDDCEDGYPAHLRAALSSADTKALDDLLDRERAKAAGEALRAFREWVTAECPHEADEHPEGCCDVCDWTFAIEGELDDRAAAVSPEGGGE